MKNNGGSGSIDSPRREMEDSQTTDSPSKIKGESATWLSVIGCRLVVDRVGQSAPRDNMMDD